MLIISNPLCVTPVDTPRVCLDAEACAEKCVKEQTYLCKSFDVDNVRRACYLFSVDHEDTDVYFVDDANVDHFQSRLFRGSR